ncbi:hypothetical protein [Streptomyces glaucescens]|uniref:hypothetical protein n=1 Tax=Streptomyces glaucescens TaxID=1907 RepID=UPI001FCC4B83|nr:hypothetical protein [Streptomyces glaucescens]
MSLTRRLRPLAFVAAAAALFSGLTAPSATAADAPTMTRLTLSGDQFRMTDTSYVAATNNLYNNHLTDHADLTEVLTTEQTTNSAGAADPWLNLRSMRACAGAETKALPPVDRAVSWCWSSAHGDDDTGRWWPQGMSSTGTADGGDGAIQGKRALAVAWHYKTYARDAAADRTGCRTNNLLKLSLIDRDTGKYRHVLLVEPTSTSSTASNFTFVTGHGGGIVWYANYLYVTDTAGGIRVFDINKLAKVDTYGSGVGTYGISGGRSSACGYPYVLPQVHYYKQASPPPSGGCSADAVEGVPDPDSLCYSWLSLDKTGGAPFKLVTGEWFGEASGGRVVRYQLNPTSSATYPGLLNLSGGKTVVQDAYAATRYRGLQGGTTWTDAQGVLHFDFHKGCGTKPAVFSHTWAGDTRPPTACTSNDLSTGNWAVGTPQALSYWPKLGTEPVEELWGLTEHICPSNALKSSYPEDFTAVDPAKGDGDACLGYDSDTSLSLRTVFAVGFDDPAVQNLH